ncbi:MAG: hypothetical protein K2J32_06400 [Ruminococcus sp.]|nr:hypothetical protein [Ruminococcus sp.]
MRFDINILWIDDSPGWQKEEQELFELRIDSFNLLTNIEYVANVDSIIERLSNESVGFKVYDMIFVDYNISSAIFGNQVINILRNNEIDADILFYSAKEEKDLKKIIFDSNGAFEGIYIATRDNFQDKAISLYKKNIKHLLSLANIRGFLADKTSENDYIINSYILKKFNELSADAQNRIRMSVQTMISNEKNNYDSNWEEYDKIIEHDKININKLMRLPSYILSLETKYKIFADILSEQNNNTFSKDSISDYLKKIVKKRNMVAHKKLDVCKQQKYIKYFDNINQFKRYACPEDCSEHTDDGKISLEEWKEIVRLTNAYSKLFDKISSELLNQELSKIG